MARKTAASTEPAADPIDMLSLIDADAPADGAIVVVEHAPPAVIAQRAASIVLLNPERFDQFYERIKARTDEFVPDLSTPTSRAAIASKAFEVTKLKTTLDKAGLALTEDWRTRTKVVNDARKPMVQRLDGLAADIRAPLTAWEEAEDARTTANAATIAEIQAAATVTPEDTAAGVDTRGREIFGRTFVAPQWTDDEAAIAEAAKQATVAALVAARNRLRQEEADRAELAALRAEREAREQREAEERAERERVEAEAAAERERVAAVERREREAAEAAQREAERIAAAEAAAVERARVEAAQEAERQRVAREEAHAAEIAAERAVREKVEAEARAAEEARERDERERAAREQAEKDAAAAEAARVEAERVEAARVEAERVANREHRLAIMGQVADDIASCGMDRDVAEKVVLAIVAGSVRHCGVSF